MKIITLLMIVLITGCMPNPMIYEYIGSPVKGIVTSNNVPVDDAIVTRTCNCGDHSDIPVQKSKTSENGAYELPVLKIFSPFILINYPTVWQEYTVLCGGESHVVYKNYRNDYQLYGELTVTNNVYNNKMIKEDGFIRLDIELGKGGTH